MRTRKLVAVVLATAMPILLAAGPSWATMPGANGRIAFVRSGSAIVLSDPDGSNKEVLIDRNDSGSRWTGSLVDPAWAPRGRRLAFTSVGTRCCPFKRTIYSIRADDTGLRRIGIGATPTFSPDGTSIAYVRKGELWITDARGSAPTQITSLGGGATEPAWSPAGDHIAFTLVGGDLPQIWTVTDSGSDPRLLIRDASAPDWAPDGTKLAFQQVSVIENMGECGGSSVGYGLSVANADGSDPVSLGVPLGRQIEDVVWSPDGANLAFTYRDLIGSSSCEDFYSENVGVADADGSDPHPLAPFDETERFARFNAAWQPLPS